MDTLNEYLRTSQCPSLGLLIFITVRQLCDYRKSRTLMECT